MRLLACVCVSVCVSVLLLGCSGVKVAECEDGEVRCGDSDQCVDLNHRCDGTSDCSNNWDELHCTSCRGSSILCDGSRCVHTIHRCDGMSWCNDGADEANCLSKRKYTACHAQSRCNGLRRPWDYINCITGDDELHCTPEMCQAPATRSTYCDGRCLKASSWCDGHADCSDGQDEAQCPGK